MLQSALGDDTEGKAENDARECYVDISISFGNMQQVHSTTCAAEVRMRKLLKIGYEINTLLACKKRKNLKFSVDAHPQTGNLSTSIWSWYVGALVIIVIGALAYSNSFQGDFVFDDVEISSNTTVHQLWPLWPSLFAPQNVNRPLIGLSLAINYAISGLNVWSYHALNLLIHILAGLALFGITRRTLLSKRMRERFGEKAFTLALVVALVWLVHPLQTQSVTYIIQRCESLMGMFYLLTLYCAIRGFDSPGKRWWYGAAIAACAAGMMSKQVMVTAPLIVLLYDFLFVSNSIKEAVRKHWPIYSGLAATWIVLAATIIASPVNETAGFAVQTITPWNYFKSEFAVIVHYLRLSLWPDSLVLDYGWPSAKTAGDILPYAIIVGLLAAATAWAVIRRRAVGFPAAWFFIVISTTSTFMPFSDLAFEHRMYLPLAGVVSLVVIGGYALGMRLLSLLPLPAQGQMRLGRSVALALATAIILSLTFLTLKRNFDYQNPIAMWRDVVKKRPDNPRGHSNLAKLLTKQGNLEEALIYFTNEYNINPRNFYSQNNLGAALTQLGKLAEGEQHLREALLLKPAQAEAHSNLGRNLAAQGRFDEAISHINQALDLDPKFAEAYFERGLAQEKQRKFAEAIDSYNLALQLQPDLDGALIQLALMLATQSDPKLRDTSEAVRLAEKAVALTEGQHPRPLDALATAYAEAGRYTEAIKTAQKAVDRASALGDKEMAGSIEARLRLYREERSRSGN